ncbi:MAG: sterol desaturase family protein, partial [Acidimicrobiales bacterium]
MAIDLTVAAIPFYFGSMGAEALWQRHTAATRGPAPGDYERDDTIASLSMGVASLVVPLATRRLFHEFDLGRGKYRRAVLGIAGGAAIATVVADAISRSLTLEAGVVPVPTSTADACSDAYSDGGTDDPTPIGPADSADRSGVRARTRAQRRNGRTLLRRVAGSTAVTTLASAGAAIAGTWAARTTAKKLFRRRVLPDWGSGPLASLAAIAGWDFIYYWNHRLQHESRFMWAIHVVHHSSERYNLSTALRQPVADSLGTFVPYGVLSLLGFRPELIERARGVNLIYQFWIHTETIRRIGPLETFLNSPSHHRVHHGSNRQYLDRNHGSILIVWDKLFGTFEPEGEPVVYGLTKNIETFNPLRIATHEYADIVDDVAGATTWSDRISFVVRSPGWAYRRHDEDGTVSQHR